MNYFELYNLPVTLKVDAKNLKQKFYELSRKYHPDFFTQDNEFEQNESLEQSALVNKAFKVFQNPDETIKYVLKLKGLLEEEEKYNLPPDFLMEMMELNEEMMEAKMEQDAEVINRFQRSIATLEAQIYEPVKAIVEGYKDEETSTQELLQVKEYYYKKKYLSRILATMQS